MSKNESTISNQENNHHDWIELYNNDDHPINLSGFYLSDNETELNKWQFPSINIPAYGYILVFASGEDYVNAQEIHTNFKISSEGESIFLSDSEGIILDHIPSVNLCSDQSYGRLPDGTSNILQLNVSTPNTSNNINNQLTFSNPNGFHTQSFYLTIHSLMEDTVYYTSDGSIPTINSQIYTDAILIEDRTSQANYFSNIPTSPNQSEISFKAWQAPSNNIDKITTIRSVSFRNGIQSSRIYTNSYFVNQEALSNYKLPIISINTEEENLFDENSGVYVPGIHYSENNPEWTGNYFQSGKLWEKPIHIEFFDSIGNLQFMQDAGLRIHGGKTRHAAQKSIKLYARDEYGTLKFNYQLMPQSSKTNYKRFLLRTSMGAWGKQTIIKDVLTHDIARDLNLEIQNFQPVIVFINGEYWGIHTLRDKIDEHYISDLYEIDKDSIDLIGGNYELIFAGDNQHYINLLDFISQNSLSNNYNYQYVCSQIDIDNYIDYQIAELFFANYDWPANNVKLWRPKTATGKWRWIFYDLDAGLLNYNYNMLQHATANNDNTSWPNSPQSTFLFRSLLKNPNFEKQFIDRYESVLKHYFNTPNTLIKAGNIQELYAHEISTHIERWNYPTSLSNWENDIEESLIQFLEKRPCAVRKNLIEFFDLQEFDFDCTDSYKHINLTLAPNPNNGTFRLHNNSDQDLIGTFKVSTISGKTCYEKNYFSLNASGNIEVNMNHLANGVYIISYKGSLFSKNLKFIKVN